MFNYSSKEYESFLKEKLEKIWMDCSYCRKKYNLAEPCEHHLTDAWKYKKLNTSSSYVKEKEVE